MTQRVIPNWIIYLAILAAFFFALEYGCGQPRYVLKFPEKLALARIDSLKKYVGKTEKTGHNDGAWVAEVLRHVGINYPAPYCAGGTVTGLDLVRGSLPLPIKRSASALGIWNDARARGTLQGYGTVKVGDIVSYGHVGTSAGHSVAVVTKVSGRFYSDIEFNTSSGSAGSQRDGGGCYRRVRKYGDIGTLKLKGAIGFKV